MKDRTFDPDAKNTNCDIAELLGYRWWKCNQFRAFQLRHPSVTKLIMDGRNPINSWDLCERPTIHRLVSDYGLPNFYGDLNACDDILVRLTNDGYAVKIESFVSSHGVEWICSIGGDLPHGPHVSNEPTVAQAICGAFLAFNKPVIGEHA